MSDLTYFKVNTNYPVGIRFNMGDMKGRVLTSRDPYVQVKPDDLRDFKRANQYAIQNGLIVETEEPSLDFDSPNIIDDAKANNIVKSKMALKQALAEVTAPHAVAKLLDAAHRNKSSATTVKMIEAKLKEFSPEENEDEDSPLIMRGVE